MSRLQEYVRDNRYSDIMEHALEVNEHNQNIMHFLVIEKQYIIFDMVNFYLPPKLLKRLYDTCDDFGKTPHDYANELWSSKLILYFGY